MARNKKRTRIIRINAPKHYDPGKGRPIEELAYISPREKRALLNSTDHTAEMTRHGILSFADDSASSVGGSNAVSRGDASQGTKGSNQGGSNTGASKGGTGPTTGPSQGGGSTSNAGGTTSNSGKGPSTGGGNPQGAGGANAGGGMMSGGARDSGSTGNKSGSGVNTGKGANAGGGDSGGGGLLGGNKPAGQQGGSVLGGLRSMESGFGTNRPAATGYRGPGSETAPSFSSPSSPAGAATRALLGGARPQTQLSRQRELESGYGVPDAARPVDRLDPNRPVGLPQVGYQPERSILSPQAKALNKFAETIGEYEGTVPKITDTLTDPDRINPYNTVFGYGQYAQPPKAPTDMTLNELAKWQREVLNPATGKINTSAVGIAQMQPDSMLEAADRLGYDPETTKFTPEVQKNLALEEAKAKGVDQGTWASLDTKAKRAAAQADYDAAIGYRDAIKSEVASYGGAPPDAPRITGDPASRAPMATPRSAGAFTGGETQSPFGTYNLEPEQAPLQRPDITALNVAPRLPKDLSRIAPSSEFPARPGVPVGIGGFPAAVPKDQARIMPASGFVSPVMGMPDIPRNFVSQVAGMPDIPTATGFPARVPQLPDLQQPAYANPNTEPNWEKIVNDLTGPIPEDDIINLSELPALPKERKPAKYTDRIIGDEEIELAREALPPDTPAYQNPPRSFANIPQNIPSLSGEPIDVADIPEYSGEPINLTQQENWPKGVKPTTGMPGNVARQPMSPTDPVALAQQRAPTAIDPAIKTYTSVKPETDMSEVATQNIIARYGEDGVEIARLVNLVNSTTGKRGDSSKPPPIKRKFFLPNTDIPMLEA